ncbi:hypothetical protein [Methylobacterium aquaticum]|jgi:hypothetical protein|uniref:hypothetical protein n=1 Tax=Methylobacterium aquaticum TaxID=270351 RepID=UPI00069F5CF0|nr:hypothetical protein [Methylobacterium aquaticum]
MKRLHQIGPGGPNAYWVAMRALTRRAGSFTIRDVVERCNAAVENTVECYVHACARSGHLDIVGERPATTPIGRPFKLYAVKVTAPETAPFEKPDRTPRLGAAHQQMWTAIRGLTSFTTRDLAAFASTDEVAISSDTARIFCWKLRQAGYLQELGRQGRWQVLRLRPGMNTGPTPPAITAGGDVIDRNPRARRRSAAR